MAETDLRGILRNPELSEENKREKISHAFHASILSKLPGHGINEPNFIQPVRPMSAIGG